MVIFADNADAVSDEPPEKGKPRWVANPGGPSGLRAKATSDRFTQTQKAREKKRKSERLRALHGTDSTPLPLSVEKEAVPFAGPSPLSIAAKRLFPRLGHR
jgi:hypothetical protein